jgi:hypothetical protein
MDTASPYPRDKPAGVLSSALGAAVLDMDVKCVAVVFADRVSPFELGVACEVFGTDRSADGIPGWEFAVCSPDGARVESWSGFGRNGLAALDFAASADLLIVPTCAP